MHYLDDTIIQFFRENCEFRKNRFKNESTESLLQKVAPYLKALRKESKMLVLGRREGEAIVIDEHIRIRVVKCRGKRITIAVEAPPEVAITREELLLPQVANMVVVKSA